MTPRRLPIVGVEPRGLAQSASFTASSPFAAEAEQVNASSGPLVDPDEVDVEVLGERRPLDWRAGPAAPDRGVQDQVHRLVEPARHVTLPDLLLVEVPAHNAVWLPLRCEGVE